jgi:hypothetical protein
VAASPLSFSVAERVPAHAAERSAGGPLGRFPGRTTLTSRDRIVLRAIAEAMFSQDGEVESARLDAHLDEVDAFISCASKPVRAGLRVALFVVRIAPVLLFLRMRTIESLVVEERVAVLSRLERSPLANLSLAFIGWRAVMTLLFYEHPIELERLGYAGEERQVYKRRLALAPARLPSIVAPPPEESGVRLRDADSGSARDDAGEESEVA